MADNIPHAQSAHPTVSIVVLNYNSMDHLGHNMDSLMRLDYPGEQIEILLVDNGSTDGSPEWVAVHYPSVRIVRNESNLGFAGGNTVAAEAASGEWVAFLNPDTRVKPNWLSELIQPARRDPDVACVASRMLSWNGDEIDFADAAINFMGWGCQPGLGSRRLGDFEQDKDLLFACGGAMLVKRRVFLNAGGFDPDYFAYYEDVDLGWRLWLMGYKVTLAARAVVYHRHHGSWASVNDAQKWALAERNTLFTLIKNFDDANLARVLPAALLLMLQRAYLDIWPDPGVFGHVPAMPTGQVFGPRYYSDQMWQLLRDGAYRQLVRRTIDEVGRRWLRFRYSRLEPTIRSVTRPIDGQFDVPAAAFGRLVAGRDVLRAIPSLLHKRQVVQSARRRTDRQVFPLFQWALLSNFENNQFIRAMRHVIARFGLADVFDKHREWVPADRRITDLSLEVSLAVLGVVDRALTLSRVSEANFRVGEGPPAGVSRVPFESVAMLAEMNRLLWSLPDAPLGDLLSWLAEGCRRITDSVVSTHG